MPTCSAASNDLQLQIAALEAPMTKMTNWTCIFFSVNHDNWSSTSIIFFFCDNSLATFPDHQHSYWRNTYFFPFLSCYKCAPNHYSSLIIVFLSFASKPPSWIFKTYIILPLIPRPAMRHCIHSALKIPLWTTISPFQSTYENPPSSSPAMLIAI